MYGKLKRIEAERIPVPEGQVRVFVYGQPVNMWLSYDGLYALTRNRRTFAVRLHRHGYRILYSI